MDALQLDPFQIKSLLLTTTVKHCSRCKKGTEIIDDFEQEFGDFVTNYVLDCKDV